MFDVTNNLFVDHSWYFRNVLVYANYSEYAEGIMRNKCPNKFTALLQHPNNPNYPKQKRNIY